MSYHFSAALDLLGAKEHFEVAMKWLPASLTGFVARKWVLAFSTFILGMALADWLVRRTTKIETRPDRFTGIWLNHKKRMLLLALRYPRFVPIDLRYELVTMNAALTSPGIGMPALPTMDPTDARIDDTRLYLSSIGSLRPDRLPEARRIAHAIADAFPASGPASSGLAHRIRERFDAMLRRRP